MKNRFFTFLTMLLMVMVVGTGATMFNLRIRQKSAESIEGVSFQITEWIHASPETGTGTGEIEKNAIRGTMLTNEEQLDELTMVFETENALAKQQDIEILDRESKADSVEEMCQSAAENERQIYYARLQDMERAHIARMNATAKESLTAQQKTADELLEIWDDELNALYQKLRVTLDDAEFRMLRYEERAWIHNRDAAANKAAISENYSKSAQNLAYTRSLLQWTRERVYELAKLYHGE